MTEQPSVPRQPASDGESLPAGPGDDSGQPDKVRTQGETAVVEATAGLFIWSVRGATRSIRTRTARAT
jgi:hypothetical protein